MNSEWWRLKLPPNDTRFDEIAPKFFFMTRKEAKSLDEDDFLNMISSSTPVSERVKFLVFVRNYWPFDDNGSSDYQSDSDDRDDNNNMNDYVITRDNFDMAERCLNEKTGYWHLNDVVKSKLFSIRGFDHLTLKVISVFSLFPTFDLVKHINLSGCSLMDEDVEDLIIVVDRCKNLKSLDISNNRIRGRIGNDSNPVVYSAIVNWLTKLELLNISICPISSTESIELFESFPDAFFKKLIFVPKNWMPVSRWKCMCQITSVTDSETHTDMDTRAEIALITHNNYYVSKSSNSSNSITN